MTVGEFLNNEIIIKFVEVRNPVYDIVMKIEFDDNSVTIPYTWPLTNENLIKDCIFKFLLLKDPQDEIIAMDISDELRRNQLIV